MHILSIAVFATARSITEFMPLELWRADMISAGIHESEVDHFVSLMKGETEVKNGTLLEDAMQSLARIRKGLYSPQELYRYHFRLLNALISGDWGNYVGPAFCSLVSDQWLHAAEYQKFHMFSPALYVPVLHAKCRASDLNGYAKIASILESAIAPTGVRVSDNVRKFLESIKSGEYKRKPHV